jgi:hypothetical protein
MKTVSKKISLDKITTEKRKKIFFKKCETKEELSKFIQVFFGLHLPDVTVSRYADTNPLDIIWEVYDICANKRNPENIEELLYVAGRGSGKTLGMAIAELLVMLHDERDICHVGAVIAQAKRCYEYQTNFMLSSRIRPILEDKDLPQEERILQKLNMEKSAFLLNGKTVTLEVLPCTLKACLTFDSPVNTLMENKWQQNILGNVKPGDVIESPHGGIEVLDVAIKEEECIRVEFENGSYIEGTLDHKVWTNMGWVELQYLTYAHEVIRHEDL